MRILLAVALSLPTAAFAAGGGGSSDAPPPKPVKTCQGSQVFDTNKMECVDPKNSSLERDDLYLAVRQLAYAGRYEDAQAVMNVMQQDDPGRLTYMGFTHRKLGNADLAMTYYTRAIDADPSNNLARSYMGQGLVEEGNVSLALVQLEEIRVHGGSGSWAEKSLRNAIATGTTYSY